MSRRTTNPNLSATELRLLDTLSQGLKAKEAGKKLYITEDTVKTHLRSIYRKLGAHNIAHAVRIACDRDLFRESADVSCATYAAYLIPALEQTVWCTLEEIKSRGGRET